MTPRIEVLAVVPSLAVENCEITLVWDHGHFATMWGRAGRRLSRSDFVPCSPWAARGHYRDAELHGRLVAPFPRLKDGHGTL